jgi:F-type H+-transporting ATPase subunit delta
MSEQRVASRYAKALIDMSKEQQIIDIVKNDLSVFQQTVHQNVQLQHLLKSPVVNNGDKIAILNKVFGKSFQKITLDFFGIVVRKNRSSVLEAISQSFMDQYNDINNIISATVKTAQAIDANVTAEITAFIEKQSGKKVAITASVDPSLIGGLVIQVGDNLYDASISGKLNKVKQNLLNTYISK